MDAIIFFCQKRGLKEPKITVIEEEGCRLIRVEVFGGEDNWFGRRLDRPAGDDKAAGWIRGKTGETRKPGKTRKTGETEKAGETRKAGKTGKPEETGKTEIRGRLATLNLKRVLEDRRERRHRLKERELLLREYERAVEETEAQMKELAEKIFAAAGGLEAACAYTDMTERMLCRGETLPGLWKRHWSVPLFSDYRALRRVKPLLAEARQPAFFILGTAPCLPEVMNICAPKMQSLTWMRSREECGEEMQEAMEEICEEYGLAVKIEPAETAGGRLLYRPQAQKPCTVLDFTLEGRTFSDRLTEGSIWIDFSSDEEKQRRIQGYTSGVDYVSLKTHWRGLGKP